MNHKVKLYIDDLESNIKLADNQSDDEVKSLLAKIVCIRISGLLEVALKSRISDYSERKTPKEIKRFLTQKFKDITNLKAKKICEILDTFSNDWKNLLEQELSENSQLKSSLDSLITLRNDIAHGQNCVASVSNVKQYFNDAKKVVDLFDTIVK